MTSYALWFLSFATAGSSFLKLSVQLWRRFQGAAREAYAPETLARVKGELAELVEIYASGAIPSARDLSRLSRLPAPWGAWIRGNLDQLSASGTGVLPTLTRWRGLFEHFIEQACEAKTQGSQAQAQLAVCVSMVPLLAFALYALFPSLQLRPWIWSAIVALALALDALGFAWMRRLSERARFAGLSRERRSWLMRFPLFGEELLGLVRAGQPPDLAWTYACAKLRSEEPELVNVMDERLWAFSNQAQQQAFEDPKSCFRHASDQVKHAIHASLLEGRGVYERLALTFESAALSIRQLQRRAIQKLGVALLKPLFLCIAPALLMLLIAALAFEMSAEWGAGAGG